MENLLSVFSDTDREQILIHARQVKKEAVSTNDTVFVLDNKRVTVSGTLRTHIKALLCSSEKTALLRASLIRICTETECVIICCD